MKSNMNDELSLEKIDDYNNKESKSKRKVIIAVVVFCLAVGAILSYVKSTSQVEDYIGTQAAPGISTTKK